MNFTIFAKSQLKRVPVIGPFLQRFWRRWNPSASRPAPPRFLRAPVDEAAPPESQQLQKSLNLLNYAKQGDKAYSASKYPGGYHTLTIGDVRLEGQRDPSFRLKLAPFDFKGKTVLDIGSNQGGMLFEVGREIKWGVGIDYDPKMVNVANRIASIQGFHHVRYYVFDVAREPLDLIRDLLPEPRVDIVFLLSVCMWIENWKTVIAFAAEISDAMLFESNGTPEQQLEQEQELRIRYASVKQLAAQSTDDANQKMRKLFYCRAAPAGNGT